MGPEGAESRVDATSVVANMSEVGDDVPEGSHGEKTEKKKIIKDEKWLPNKNYLRALMSMGIRKSDAVKALYHTNNSSADSAATWLFESIDTVNSSQMPPGWSLHDAMSSPDGSSASSSDDEGDLLSGDLYKMVFVINGELTMGTGKVGAQVGHAAVGLFRVLMSDEFRYGRMLCAWEDSGETKICLKGKNTQELLDLEKSAQEKDLPCYLVEDAGRTQVPAGSLTVLSIFGKVEDVNSVTGKLRLL